MSLLDPNRRQEPPRSANGGCLSALLVLVGVLLLLPGLCSLFTILITLTTALQNFRQIPQALSDPSFLSLGVLWLVTFAISWGGIQLIRKATRGNGR